MKSAIAMVSWDAPDLSTVWSDLKTCCFPLLAVPQPLLTRWRLSSNMIAKSSADHQ
jgi:hypothetical protein